MIFTKEETFEKDSFNDKELDEFIDSLNSEQFVQIQTFFETMPKLTHTAKYKCGTCGESKETKIEGRPKEEKNFTNKIIIYVLGMVLLGLVIYLFI